jgi:electron transport complex protein RnfB
LNEEHDIYKKLARHIDQMPVAFPATESGVEIRILKYLFTPEEAEIALHLSALPEPADKIYKRLKKTGISKDKLEKTLDGMVAKGSIMGGRFFKSKGEKKYYSKALLAVGMYELQVNKLTKEFVDNMSQYIEEGFAEAFITPKTSQLKTIPIKSSCMPEHNIATYDDIKHLVMKTEGKIAVFNCVCRQEKIVLGTPCKQTDRNEICLGFNEAADYVIERRNASRYLNKMRKTVSFSSPKTL